jgi:hypothetical protein
MNKDKLPKDHFELMIGGLKEMFYESPKVEDNADHTDDMSDTPHVVKCKVCKKRFQVMRAQCYKDPDLGWVYLCGECMDVIDLMDDVVEGVKKIILAKS